MTDQPTKRSLWTSISPVIAVGLAIALLVSYCGRGSGRNAVRSVIDVTSATAAAERCRQVVAVLAADAAPLSFEVETFEYKVTLHGRWQGDTFPSDFSDPDALFVSGFYEILGRVDSEYSRPAEGIHGFYQCWYDWMGTRPRIGDPEDVRLGSLAHWVLKPYVVRVSLNIDEYGLPLNGSEADGVMTFYCSSFSADTPNPDYCPYAEAFGV